MKKQEGQEQHVLPGSMVKYLLKRYKPSTTICKLIFDKHYRPNRYNAIVNEQGQYAGKESEFYEYVEGRVTRQDNAADLKAKKHVLESGNLDEFKLLRMMHLRMRLSEASIILFFAIAPIPISLLFMRKISRTTCTFAMLPGFLLTSASLTYHYTLLRWHTAILSKQYQIPLYQYQKYLAIKPHKVSP